MLLKYTDDSNSFYKSVDILWKVDKTLKNFRKREAHANTFQ